MSFLIVLLRFIWVEMFELSAHSGIHFLLREGQYQTLYFAIKRISKEYQDTNSKGT